MKIYSILMALLVLAVLIMPCAADDSAESIQAAGKLYSDSVDLANAGKYPEALDAADKALAMNVTSLIGVIQSNRAGILVMQNRYDDAITAADAALAVEGNLTAVHSIAWYNKGNALRALGRISEAQDAYAKAYALDNTLVPPDMSADVTSVPVSSTHTVPVSPTPKSPFSAGLVLAALGVVAFMVSGFGKKINFLLC
ncbi:MAG: tetratricopeptide repeat protein [Methanoregula sp.]|jgi:tetratricopeptide (TPR) repeat protein